MTTWSTESELRRGKLSARMLWGNEASVLVGDFLLGQAFRMMVEVGSLRALDILSAAAATIARRSDAARRGQEHRDHRGRISGRDSRQDRRVVRGACEVGPTIANRPKAEQNRVPFGRHESRHRVPARRRRAGYGGKSAKLGKNIGDDSARARSPSPSCWRSAAAMTASARSGSRR